MMTTKTHLEDESNYFTWRNSVVGVLRRRCPCHSGHLASLAFGNRTHRRLEEFVSVGGAAGKASDQEGRSDGCRNYAYHWQFGDKYDQKSGEVDGEQPGVVAGEMR